MEEANGARLLETGKLLLENDRYLIITHEKPDGDAWGSMLALARWLRGHKKDVVTLISSEDADSLPLIDSLIGARVSSLLEPPSDLAERKLITVDLAGLSRLGFDLDQPEVWLQIDHHPDNQGYAAHNLILSDRPATAQILWEMIRLTEAEVGGYEHESKPLTLNGPDAERLRAIQERVSKILVGGFPADRALALPLAVGLLTDTLQLSTPHTNASSYVMAGELLAAGVNVPNLTLELQKELDAKETLGLLELLSQTEMLYDDQLAVLIVTRGELERVGLSDLHTHNALSILRVIRGARAFLVLVEEADAPGEHKGSLRSTDPSLAIASVARRHGGGGHEQAAGFNLRGSYEEVEREVDQMITELGELLCGSPLQRGIKTP